MNVEGYKQLKGQGWYPELLQIVTDHLIPTENTYQIDE